MPTSHLEQRPRQRQPYAELFRDLDPQQRADELAALKKLHEDDKLSIRQIAARKKSSYGFIQARLVEAAEAPAASSTSSVSPAQQDQQ